MAVMREILEHARLMDRAAAAGVNRLMLYDEANDEAVVTVSTKVIQTVLRDALMSALDVLAASDAAGEPKTSGEVVGSPEILSAPDGAYRGGSGEMAE